MLNVCRVFLALMIMAAWILPSHSSAASDVPVGVLRWDFWYNGNLNGSYLENNTYFHRIPFYSGPNPQTAKWEWRGDNQEVMDQEIGYARDAGISYFIFNYYNDYRIDGTLNPNSVGRKSLNNYLKSRRNKEVNFSLLIDTNGFGPWKQWSQTRQTFIDLISRPEYQKLSNGRPVVYLWIDTWLDSLMANEPGKGLGALSEIKAGVKAKIGVEPYFVYMGFDATKAVTVVSHFSLDAATSYSNPLGNNSVEYGYGYCAALNSWFRDNLKSKGLQVVPIINSGWDPRPVAGKDPYVTRSATPDFCTKPTPQQIADNLKSGIDWVKANPASASPRTVIVYAWNEFTEGGWLTPTLAEGNLRLKAIKNMLNPPTTLQSTGPITGWIDYTKISADRFYLYGWICSTGSRDPVEINLYTGGEYKKGGKMITAWHANELSGPSVATACKSTGVAYRYIIDLPVSWVSTEAGKPIYVYGLIREKGISGLSPGSGRLVVPTIP